MKKDAARRLSRWLGSFPVKSGDHPPGKERQNFVSVALLAHETEQKIQRHHVYYKEKSEGLLLDKESKACEEEQH